MGVRTHVHVKGRTYVTSANLLVNSGNYIFLFFVFLVGGKLEKPIGDGGDDDSGGRDAGDDGDDRGGIIVHKLSQLVIIVGIVMGSSSFPPTQKKK